jgi:hypothetical protein
VQKESEQQKPTKFKRQKVKNASEELENTQNSKNAQNERFPT